jgi:hypothetical protein
MMKLLKLHMSSRAPHTGIARALIPRCIILLSEPHKHTFLGFMEGLGGVYAVLNARSRLCGCVRGTLRFTPPAWVMC